LSGDRTADRRQNALGFQSPRRVNVDPLIYAVVLSTLVIVAATATCLPAMHTSRIDATGARRRE
jgi:multisubunit Na+/H+ antiporter MnhC subunit